MTVSAIPEIERAPERSERGPAIAGPFGATSACEEWRVPEGPFTRTAALKVNLNRRGRTPTNPGVFSDE